MPPSGIFHVTLEKVSVMPSKYLRFQDFLRSIPSRMRHDSVSRVTSGYSSQQCATIKRPLSAQLIRMDKFLAPLLILECTTNQSKITKEHLWLADMVFSLLYFDTFRKDQGGLDDIAESRKHVMKSGQDFVWHDNDQSSEDVLEKILSRITFYDGQSRSSAPKFLERFRRLCRESSAIELRFVKGSKSQMEVAAEKLLDGIVSEFNELVKKANLWMKKNLKKKV